MRFFLKKNKPVCWFGVDSRSFPPIFIILWFLRWSRDPRPLRWPRPPCRPWFPWHPEVKKSTEPATNALALELVLGKLWAKFDKFENLLWLLTDSTSLLVVVADVLAASEDVFLWSKRGPTSVSSGLWWCEDKCFGWWISTWTSWWLEDLATRSLMASADMEDVEAAIPALVKSVKLLRWTGGVLPAELATVFLVLESWK